jgi:acylphosphatase
MVQGVGFRMFVAREADKLGIAGYTRNRFDGRVEVLAHGTAPALTELKAALERGPRFASVSGVQEEAADLDAQHRHSRMIEPGGKATGVVGTNSYGEERFAWMI